jgi:hypothetical protein
MQSEFVRLVKQVEYLEKLHRAGLTHAPSVDELFAAGRECRAVLDAEAPALPVAPAPSTVVPVFKSPEASTLAAEAGAAVAHALEVVFARAARQGLGPVEILA